MLRASSASFASTNSRGSFSSSINNDDKNIKVDSRHLEALIFAVMKDGHEREVALYCLQKVRFHSASSAINYLKKRDPSTGKRCHVFVNAEIDIDDVRVEANICVLCKLPNE